VRAAEVADELITVGRRGEVIAHAAVQAGMEESAVQFFGNNQQVIEYLRKKLHPADVVLVKGSRGMQMEVIVSSLEARR
jgi:UDP-N-acetylmuramoyl-tripeptide--D-alanyl-D-alanine ligase